MKKKEKKNIKKEKKNIKKDKKRKNGKENTIPCLKN